LLRNLWIELYSELHVITGHNAGVILAQKHGKDGARWILKDFDALPPLWVMGENHDKYC
jgi:hypothetical protein